MPAQHKIGSGNGKAKGRQQSKNRSLGKYRRQFIRTVLRTGKWRGKPKTLADAR